MPWPERVRRSRYLTRIVYGTDPSYRQLPPLSTLARQFREGRARRPLPPEAMERVRKANRSLVAYVRAKMEGLREYVNTGHADSKPIYTDRRLSKEAEQWASNARGDQKYIGSASKLGDMLAISLPAGPARLPGGRVVSFCPGATPACSATCYAKTGNFRYDNVKRATLGRGIIAYNDPWAFARGWDRILSRYEARGKHPTVRVSVSGDLFSKEYIDALSWLARRHPRIQFYTYTRSWRNPMLRLHIERKLRSLPNFTVNASTDLYTGPPPEGWREAALGYSWRRNTAICPSTLAEWYNRGKGGRMHRPTCSECGLCIRKNGPDVAFVPHDMPDFRKLMEGIRKLEEARGGKIRVNAAYRT